MKKINIQWKLDIFKTKNILEKKEIVLHSLLQIKGFNDEISVICQLLENNQINDEILLDDLYIAFIDAIVKTNNENLEKTFSEIESHIIKSQLLKKDEEENILLEQKSAKETIEKFIF